jgi:hypothetical protein
VRRPVRASRAVLGAVVLSGVLSLPFGVAVSQSGASPSIVATVSPFCSAMVSTHPSPPTSSNYATYHSWAKRYLKYYEKLTSLAPSASVKRNLGEIIVILKYESSTSSLVKLRAYVVAHQAKWAQDWQVFARAIIACAASIPTLL